MSITLEMGMRQGRWDIKGINKVELIKWLTEWKAKEKVELKMTSGLLILFLISFSSGSVCLGC